jgi:hypothetical protein
MYVMLDRALPHIGDGLKPVQRRIVYAMSELGLSAAAKHKKSARTVGDVLGKFHPHGDSACYEAMVLMAQPFSYRYPLVDGQGNFGSPDDPKSFAAMRYTESRLTAYARTCCWRTGPGHGRLGAQFRRHPAGTVAAAGAAAQRAAERQHRHRGRHVHRHPAAQSARGRQRLHPAAGAAQGDRRRAVRTRPGPDFPTEAEIITPAAEMRRCTKPAHGSVRMRAVWEKEHGEIVITALPHQVSGQGAGADRRADAGQEAADGRGPARRVRPREPDAAGHRAALQPGGPGTADEPPVRHHRPGAQLPGQLQHDRHQRQAAGDEPARPAERVAGLPHGHGAPPPATTGWTR